MRKTLARLAIVMLVAAGTGTMVAGLASAEPEAPAGVLLPSTQPGDAADYAGPVPLRAVVLGEGVAQDAQGRHVTAWHLQETLQHGSGDEAWQEVRLHATVEGEALFSRIPTGESEQVISVQSDGEESQRTDAVGVYAAVAFGALLHLCGLPAAPGERMLPLDGPVDLPGDCGGPLRHARTEGPLHVFANGATEVAYAPGQAFPAWVRMGGERWALQVTGRTEVEPMSKEARHDPVLPAVGQGPAGRLGPDAEALRQGVRLLEALERAQEDLEEPAVRDYMRDHPDWFVSAAASTTDPDGRVTRWAFTLDSDGPALRAWLYFGYPDAPDLPVQRPGSPVPLPLPVPAPWPADDGVYLVTAASSTDLPAAAFPETAPDPGQVALAWRAYAGVPTGLVDWGFEASCPDPCKTLSYHVQAGNSTSELNAAPGPEGERAWVDSSLVVDATGALVGRHERSVEAVGSHEPAPLMGAHIMEPSQRNQAPLRPLSAAWTAPSPEAAAGVATASILAGLGYLAVAAVKAGGIAGLFSRVHGPAVAEHPVRRRILTAIEAQPGIHHQALQRACAVGRGALDHHVQKLAAEGLVSKHRSGGYTCFFPGRAAPARVAAAGALKAEGARRIWEAVQAHPGSPAGAVATRAGLDPSTVTHHVRRLQEAGLVEARREGRTVTLHPKAAAP